MLQQVHDEIQKVALGDESAAAAATSIQGIADQAASN